MQLVGRACLVISPLPGVCWGTILSHKPRTREAFRYRTDTAKLYFFYSRPHATRLLPFCTLPLAEDGELMSCSTSWPLAFARPLGISKASRAARGLQCHSPDVHRGLACHGTTRWRRSCVCQPLQTRYHMQQQHRSPIPIAHSPTPSPPSLPPSHHPTQAHLLRPSRSSMPSFRQSAGALLLLPFMAGAFVVPGKRGKDQRVGRLMHVGFGRGKGGWWVLPRLARQRLERCQGCPLSLSLL